MNALVYDIEIIKAIPQKGEATVEGVEYCKGWGDHANMGVSVIGAYDYVEKRYRVFCEDNFDEFFDLIYQRSLLVSFNGIGFDNKVLNAVGSGKLGMPIHEGYYDVLLEIWKSAGGRFKGSGLDAVCEANSLGKKSGHGALAPIQWQRGERGAVIDYCLNDVKMTKGLFELCQRGPIKSARGELRLRRVDAHVD